MRHPSLRSSALCALILTLTPAATCSRTGIEGEGGGGGDACAAELGACVAALCACLKGDRCCCEPDGDGGGRCGSGQAPDAEPDPCFAPDGGPCEDELTCGTGCGLPDGECCCLCQRSDGGCCSAPLGP